VSQSKTTPSIMGSPRFEAVDQTVKMLLDVLPWLSDRNLDRILAKVSQEKLSRVIRDTIILHGGK
jgi:hypothetical protein